MCIPLDKGGIFTTVLNIMGSPFQAFSKDFVEWVALFWDFGRCPKVTKMGSIIGHGIDQK